jgi:thioredoxin-related protein
MIMLLKKPKSILLAFISFLIIVAATVAAQKVSEEKKNSETIKWMTFEEALVLNKKKPKMIFIDLYTDWCGWCKKMDAETFTDPEVVKYMNKKYYAVKFNAEQKEPVIFKEQEFVNPNPAKSKSTHKLALALLKNELLYPSYVILDNSSDWIYKMKGYKTPDELLPLLNFYGDGDYLKMSWIEYSSKEKK